MQMIDGLVLGVKDRQSVAIGKINKCARKISSVRFFLINNNQEYAISNGSGCNGVQQSLKEQVRVDLRYMILRC